MTKNHKFILYDPPGEGRTTVPFRTTLNQMITQDKLLILLGSDHLLRYNYEYNIMQYRKMRTSQKNTNELENLIINNNEIITKQKML